MSQEWVRVPLRGLGLLLGFLLDWRYPGMAGECRRAWWHGMLLFRREEWVLSEAKVMEDGMGEQIWGFSAF